MKRTQGISDQEFAIEIVGRDSPFVALVGEHGEFLQLYDKRRILAGLKNFLVKPVQAT
jgi:hypothetical protein